MNEKTFSSKDKVNFGEHKGKRWEDLSEGYLWWLKGNMKHESIKSQAEHELNLRLITKASK